jgi:hypothetical protein
MMPRKDFHPLQAVEIAKAFADRGVGPFDVDLVFAPDGIDRFSDAKARGVRGEAFWIANLRDIIASKRASRRQKDLIDLPLLEAFRLEYESRHARPLRTASEVAEERSQGSDGG